MSASGIQLELKSSLDKYIVQKIVSRRTSCKCKFLQKAYVNNFCCKIQGGFAYNKLSVELIALFREFRLLKNPTLDRKINADTGMLLGN